MASGHNAFSDRSSNGQASFDADRRAIVRVDQELEQGRRVWWEHGIESRCHRRHLADPPWEGFLLFDRGIYPPVDVDLFDTSAGGACLITPHPLEVLRGDQADLRIAGHPQRRVWVCWSEVRDQLTALGVAFEQPEGLAA